MEKTENDFDGSPSDPLRFMYKNYRGEHAERRVLPRCFRFGTSEYHPKPQWLLLAYDLDKKALREFSFEEIRCPETGGWWSRAFEDVAVERRRQVDAEGMTAGHDDGYSTGEMALAASVYAAYASSDDKHRAAQRFCDAGRAPAAWPWSRSWWKPTTVRRMLVKAGALIIAEIERLDRRDDVK